MRHARFRENEHSTCRFSLTSAFTLGSLVVSAAPLSEAALCRYNIARHDGKLLEALKQFVIRPIATIY